MSKSNKSDIFLSKTLSHLLRHSAVKEGLNITSEGFVQVSELLSHRFLRNKYHLEDIERVVATNDKQRFLLRDNNGVLEIRANQGHSLPVVHNLELIPITDPSSVSNVIHGTYIENLNSIKRKGLSRMRRNHIHFAYDIPSNQAVTSGIRKTANVFIYIDLEKALKDGLIFYKSANGVILSPGNSEGDFGYQHIDEIRRYFSQFGRIAYENVLKDNDNILIEYAFTDIRAHSKIIYMDHYLFDQPLIITWEEVTDLPPFPNQSDLNRSQTRSQIPEEPIMRPIPKKIDPEISKQSILNAIKDAPTFTDQIFLLQSKLQVSQNEIEQKRQMIYDDLKSALAISFPLSRIYFFGSSVTGLDVQTSDLDIYIGNVRDESKPEVQTLKTIKNIIFKCRKFCDVLLISGAKIPVIKCIHTKTQMCCDLSIRNKMSVCNSQLIRYYVSLDEKIKTLMILIKFWAESNDLKKINFFSSYALYMMVIFYLQHAPCNLPTVRELQKNVAPELIDGWNCAFRQPEFCSPALQNESLPNLVAGFFLFYSYFDYTTLVISPYFGQALDKTCFLKPYDLIDYTEYKKNEQDLNVTSGICIQDPFEQSRNVAAAIPFQCIGRFVVLCHKALKLIEKDGPHLLYNMFTHKPSLDYSFTLDKPQDRNEKEWMELVTKITIKILTEICGMKINKTISTDPINFTCSGEQDIWDGRTNIVKNLLKELPPETSDMEREIATTNCMMKYLKQTLPISFSMDMGMKQNPPRIEFTLKPLKKCKIFLHAVHFFKVRLEKFLYLAEKEVMNNDVLKHENTEEQAVLQSEVTQIDENIIEDDKSNIVLLDTLNVESNQVMEQTNEANQTSKVEPNTEDQLIEEEEDVPADFFDDFANQDFMDGLDIVDAWDYDKVVGEENKDKVSKKKSHSPLKHSGRSPGRIRKRSTSRSSRKYKKSNSTTRKKSRSKSREKIRLSDRRDPEKTRRDIHKDKLKCAKDREQKIVNDKLKLVETGLIPPGMEMETDLSTILPEKRPTNERSRERKFSSSDRPRDSKLSSPDRRDLKMSREKERRYSRRSTSREIRKHVRYSPSPSYKSRIREREPIHRSRKRSASGNSEMSEREMWIRRKRTRTRSRSPHSLHQRSISKKYEEQKKKTFLEEIRDKLNETSRPVAPVQSVPVTYSVNYNETPAPVPAPQYFPSQQNTVQYDQSFFIGDNYEHLLMNQSLGFTSGGSNTGNIVPMLHSPLRELRPPPAPLIKPQTVVLPGTGFQNLGFSSRETEKSSVEDIGKLFADKKISLSDFLAITAKCEAQSSSPEHLQKKIRVISRCQEAIKTMTDDRKFSGQLTVRPSSELNNNKNEVKYQSPLRKIPVVRFQYTTPPRNSEDIDSFAAALDKILHRVGVLKTSVGNETNSVAKLTNYVDEETVALTLRASLLKAGNRSECEECKKRKAIKYADVGAQCADNTQTVSIATQVTEEDLNPFKGLNKNASIAYLTPAQLLGRDREKQNEMQNEMKSCLQDEAMINTSPIKRPRPSPKPFRGGFRQDPREAPQHSNYYNNYGQGYEQEEEGFEAYNEPVFESKRESFGRPFGDTPLLKTPTQGSPFPVPYKLGENHNQPLPRGRGEANFTNFQRGSFRGRGNRGRGPRY